MNRRKFLAAIGIGTAVGPKVVSDMGSLHLGPLGDAPGLAAGASDVIGGPIGAAGSQVEWAMKKLAKKKAMDFIAKSNRKRDFNIHALDANTHALRSMSLVNKIRVSKDKQFDLMERREISHLERVVAGLDDYW